MKTAFLVILLFGLPAMANQITCIGQNTSAKLVLGLTGKSFPLDSADYSYNGKTVPTSGYQFGIESNKDGTAEKLTYKFLTLKKHKLANKKSNLIFSISEVGSESDPFAFTLRAGYQAQLALENDGTETVLDQMTCTDAI